MSAQHAEIAAAGTPVRRNQPLEVFEGQESGAIARCRGIRASVIAMAGSLSRSPSTGRHDLKNSLYRVVPPRPATARRAATWDSNDPVRSGNRASATVWLSARESRVRRVSPSMTGNPPLRTHQCRGRILEIVSKADRCFSGRACHSCVGPVSCPRRSWPSGRHSCGRRPRSPKRLPVAVWPAPWSSSDRARLVAQVDADVVIGNLAGLAS